jgi:hypothetical protein
MEIFLSEDQIELILDILKEQSYSLVEELIKTIEDQVSDADDFIFALNMDEE